MNDIKQNSTNQAILEGKSTQVNGITGLSVIQEKCAFSLAFGARITDVAEELGINRGTIYRWLQTITFSCFLNYLRRQNQEQSIGKLFTLYQDAIKGLEDCLRSENQMVKLNASKWVLEKIAEQEVKDFDARDLIRQECTESGGLTDWEQPQLNTAKYKQRLRDEGLEDFETIKK